MRSRWKSYTADYLWFIYLIDHVLPLTFQTLHTSLSLDSYLLMVGSRHTLGPSQLLFCTLLGIYICPSPPLKCSFNHLFRESGLCSGELLFPALKWCCRKLLVCIIVLIILSFIPSSLFEGSVRIVSSLFSHWGLLQVGPCTLLTFPTF